MYLLIIRNGNFFSIETEKEFDSTWKNSVETNIFTVVKHNDDKFWKLNSNGNWDLIKEGEKSGL